ncbi:MULTISPECIES: hypothetical protein [Azorhizobium]|uniref:hypothetical protein n=1 Tax=Azorhizobium TaxID=6 RepID=UPI000307963C|nr:MULTISPECIES: hypothetical protein [Azorhizobium]TDT96423.1 hypothetical protein DFO45_1615 [Azorhizobium sp. AG788]
MSRSHSHASPPPRRPRPDVRVGGSALRASLGVRLGVAVALGAVMWAGVLLVLQS